MVDRLWRFIWQNGFALIPFFLFVVLAFGTGQLTACAAFIRSEWMFFGVLTTLFTMVELKDGELYGNKSRVLAIGTAIAFISCLILFICLYLENWISDHQHVNVPNLFPSVCSLPVLLTTSIVPPAAFALCLIGQGYLAVIIPRPLQPTFEIRAD